MGSHHGGIGKSPGSGSGGGGNAGAGAKVVEELVKELAAAIDSPPEK